MRIAATLALTGGLLIGCTSPIQAPEAADDTCSLSSLPPEAAATVELIEAGGPFPHPRNDGTRFGNYEGRLPEHDRDYYREYTVPTPGLGHRGTRRIVTGGDPPDFYYTDDHYESFCLIGDA
ncbi:ribonuclease domain-containing protein [Mycobacterium sp. AMU20-3851]|uniref:ribonuclease domain-containing protein n=1 Tax=Mycobacterium sp. AMU20-3851 TaxID=3122055 RepID=UPI003754792C